MSIYENLVKTVKRDLIKLAEAYAHNIVNSNSMPHAEYTVVQTRYRTLSDIVGHINTGLKFIDENPDAECPDSFLNTAPGVADPEQKPSEATVHSVDIDSGSISRGSN